MNADTSLLAPVSSVMRTDVTSIPHNLTVGEALQHIRAQGVGEKIVYFYVVDENNKLIGVLPTRKLLTSPLHEPVSRLMVTRVLYLPATASVLEACEMFLMYRFLALPVVDEQLKLLGVVNITLLSDEAFSLAEKAQIDSLFQSIGLRLAELKTAAPTRTALLRAPWLIATIIGGFGCAAVATLFQIALTKSVILSLFLALILAIGESICTQSLTITLQALHNKRPTLDWLLKNLRREAITGFLLALLITTIVGLLASSWMGLSKGILVLVVSIPLIAIAACLIGFLTPAILHFSRMDVKIASGPVALALTDISTITLYLSIAYIILT